jgi:hypothetical protein
LKKAQIEPTEPSSQALLCPIQTEKTKEQMATAVGSMNVDVLSRRVRVRAASVDTQQRLSYNPNAPKNPFKNLNPKPNNFVPTSTAPAPSSTVTLTAQTVSGLLKRTTVIVQGTPQFHICFSLSLLMFL